MKIVKAPQCHDIVDNETSVFLAGSIEMGKAEDWQEKVTNELTGVVDVIYNPRRDDWDASWKQEASNPQFREQVLWELNHLRLSTYILMYFSPETKSPISLLELGLHSGSNIIVCCPKGFWRRGNVEIVCQEYGIPFYDNLDDAIKKLKKIFK